MTEEQRLWFRQFAPAPMAPVRLFCFPHAGGSASYFRATAQALAPVADVHAVQYSGRQDRYREPLVPDLASVADVVAGLIGDGDERPMAFFGHSMGATLAFEVARRLERAGKPLAALFVSARPAPSVPDRRRLHLLPDPDLVAEIKALEGTQSWLFDDEEIRAMILPVLRNDHQAVEGYRYVPGPPLGCEIIALHGKNDPLSPAADVARWQEQTRGRFSIHSYPGGHFYLDAAHRAVHALLARHLAEPVRSSSPAGS
jgi:pyochelin biosynthetic protein PchC